MPESGHMWQKAFKREPVEAVHVRLWIAGRVRHPDAPLIANELFVAVLSSGAAAVEMTPSTAGSRIRITATGPDPLPLISNHGPGWTLLSGLATIAGLSTDECRLWAQLGTNR
ncbi:hypothetical protein GCM10018980_76190 [Streptomyces capoamus]|uniref:Uncharacterized protein n=1 Tax=Streptomyces capoamus TaxID=68183 RepID=A0A919KGB4_9ACTN|nr:hypothetical protein GCM10010501_25590 [Streptomyces libani subsp. rufus]GHG77687.1 hypothetical protein GCM10018980_76190 [Streptomyces capoamus]